VRGQGHTLEMAFEELVIIVWQQRADAAGVEVVAQRHNDEHLDLGGGNAAHQSARLGLPLQHGLGDVIAVAEAALVGVGWAHAVAAMVEKASGQERGQTPQPAAPRYRLIGKLALHRGKQLTIENGLVLAAVNLVSVDYLADIEAVLEPMLERAHVQAAPPHGAPSRYLTRRSATPPTIDV